MRALAILLLAIPTYGQLGFGLDPVTAPSNVRAVTYTIIPDARRVTWAGNVGVDGGIPDSSTMTVAETLGPLTTLAQALTALTIAPSNQVVQLEAGTYTWTGVLDFVSTGSGKVLRGSTNASGYPTTIIESPNATVLMRTIALETALQTDADLTANGAKGATTISVTTPAWAIPGDIIGLDQLDASLISTNYGQEAGNSYREGQSQGARGLAQLLKIVSTNATTITFDIPLMVGFYTSNTAQIFKPLRDTALYSPRRRCGIENIIWKHTGTPVSQNHMVKMENTEDCWLKNFHGTNLVGGIYVYMVGAYRCEVRKSRFDNSQLVSSGNGYGVALYHFSTGNLIEDNIFTGLHTAMQAIYGSGGNVFGYNFATNGLSDSSQAPSMGTHGSTAHNNLFEGNWISGKFLGDNTHGSNYRNTVARNRIVGKNGVETNDQTAVSIERYNREFHVVGNLLGSAAWHTNYMSAPTSANYTNSIATCSDYSIFKLGYWSNYGCDDQATDNWATLTPILVFNYDTVTAGINDTNGFPFSAVPSSYYVSSKPACFGALNWPPYSPLTTTASALSHTNIAAGYRYTYNADP